MSEPTKNVKTVNTIFKQKLFSNTLYCYYNGLSLLFQTRGNLDFPKMFYSLDCII